MSYVTCSKKTDEFGKHAAAFLLQSYRDFFFFFVAVSENLSRWLVTVGVNWRPHLQIHDLDCNSNGVCELQPVGSAYFLKCLLRFFFLFFLFFLAS